MATECFTAITKDAARNAALDMGVIREMLARLSTFPATVDGVLKDTPEARRLLTSVRDWSVLAVGEMEG